MAHKIYQYKGNLYCEEDLSRSHKNYKGDLAELFWKMVVDGKAKCHVLFEIPGGTGTMYSTEDDAVEKELSELEIGETE